MPMTVVATLTSTAGYLEVRRRMVELDGEAAAAAAAVVGVAEGTAAELGEAQGVMTRNSYAILIAM
jgi:hypothetical protein